MALDPYLPPASVPEAPGKESAPEASRSAPSPKLSMALALLPFLAWGSCATEIVDADVGFYLWAAASGLALIGTLTAIAWRRRAPSWAVPAAVMGVVSPIATFFLALLVAPGFQYSRGRALRRGGRARLPESERRDDWARALPRFDSVDDTAASGWRLNAATEHASIAAFSHLATELMALGAPPELVMGAHEDALDEIRHTELCYGIASAIDGKAIGPSSFPSALRPRDGHLTLASLAADCLIESCLYESASAKAAAALAAREDVPSAIHRVLETIAVDEARHARHGAEIVAWCLRRGGEPVREALARALEAVSSRSENAAAPDGYEPWGLAGPSLWARCVKEAFDETRRLVPRGSSRAIVQTGSG